MRKLTASLEQSSKNMVQPKAMDILLNTVLTELAPDTWGNEARY